MDSLSYRVIDWNKGVDVSSDQELVCEEPLSIWIQGKPYSVSMHTPGHETALVAGFCLSEGIVETLDDFQLIEFCDDKQANHVKVTLKQSRWERVSQILEERDFSLQDDISGKGFVQNFCRFVSPFTDGPRVDAKKALLWYEELGDRQFLRRKTRASHAAALYGSNFELLSVAEDIGRHNALDKAIGKLFLERRLNEASFLVLSSRIGSELVQKAAIAGIPVILAVSRPSTLAVELGLQLNMTLACLAKESEMYIFCGEHRLIR